MLSGQVEQAHTHNRTGNYKEALAVLQDRRASNTASKGGEATNNHTLKSLPHM